MLTNKLPRSSPSRVAILIVAIAALTLTLGACSSSSKTATKPSGGKQTDITIKDFSFTVTSVAAGATVTVHNSGQATHTVTANDGTSFDKTVDPGKDVTFTAPAKAGTYPFHCNIHTQMKAKLIVT